MLIQNNHVLHIRATIYAYNNVLRGRSEVRLRMGGGSSGVKIILEIKLIGKKRSFMQMFSKHEIEKR